MSQLGQRACIHRRSSGPHWLKFSHRPRKRSRRAERARTTADQGHLFEPSRRNQAERRPHGAGPGSFRSRIDRKSPEADVTLIDAQDQGRRAAAARTGSQGAGHGRHHERAALRVAPCRCGLGSDCSPSSRMGRALKCGPDIAEPTMNRIARRRLCAFTLSRRGTPSRGPSGGSNTTLKHDETGLGLARIEIEMAQGLARRKCLPMRKNQYGGGNARRSRCR